MNHPVNINFLGKQLWLIWYTNRSGSTLLLNELNKYTKIVCLPEGERLVDLLLSTSKISRCPDSKMVAKLNYLFENDWKLKIWNIKIDDVDLRQVRTNADLFLLVLFKTALRMKPDFDVVIFKDTHIGFYVEELLKSKQIKLPISLFLMIRDPRAVYSSQKRTVGSWGKVMSKNPIITAKEWNDRVNKFNGLVGIGLTSSNIICYEELVVNADEFMRQLIMQQDSSLLNYSKVEQNSYFDFIPSHLKTIHKLVLEPMDNSRITKWKSEISLSEIKAIELFAKLNMKKQGYELIDNRNGFSQYFSVSVWIAKSFVNFAKRIFYQKRELPPLNG